MQLCIERILPILLRNLKVLCLYLNTLIIGHKLCNLLGILNKLTLQICFGQKSKTTTTTKHNIKHNNPRQSLEWNPEPLAPQMDALPLDHRVN